MTAPAVLQPAHFRPDRLREAREARNLSLRSVAGVTGIHHTIISRFERGAVEPRPSVLTTLSALYGVHPGDLFGPQA